MTLAGNQQQLWSEMLSCPGCKKIYSDPQLPVTLECGHLLCVTCVKNDGVCPIDKATAKWDESSKVYINGSVLAITLDNKENTKVERTMKSLCSPDDPQYSAVEKLEKLLDEFAAFLYKVDSEKGATISSGKISRTIQRKLFSLLCTNLWQKEGRVQLIQILRSMSERIVSELILFIQSNSNLSSSLWTAVRGRGCQFLGPAMQEDVLRLILHTLKNGESIARKTLVLYVVDTLAADYPHISKTCVGHVVQLLYRASCFNVIKRDGESSLMQLKEQFRDYENLRAEHDAQIVQIAMEAGLRISSDQWSSLLYGDSRHRAYMQSICERLSTNSLQNAVEELRHLVEQQPTERNLFGIQSTFDHFNAIIEEKLDSIGNDDKIDWNKLHSLLSHLYEIMQIYSKFVMNRNSEREHRMNNIQNTRNGYGMPRGRGCREMRCQQPFDQDFYHQSNGNTKRTPLRAVNAMPAPMDFGYRPPNPLLCPIQQPPSLSSYLEQQQQPPFPIGTPPGFVAPLPFVSPTRYTNVENNGGPAKPLSQISPNLMPNQQAQMDSIETMGNQLIPMLPTHQYMPTFMEPINSVTTTTNTLVPTTIINVASNTSPAYANSPSFILLGNNSNPGEGATTQLVQGNALIATSQSASTSPPGYQLTPGGFMATPGFSIPVQSQPVILYGSTPPFGSPPLLISQFTNWTTPLDSGGLIGAPSFFNINSGQITASTAADQSFHELDDDQNANMENNKRCRRSSRAVTEDDDAECHVSFTVANSVLHGHDESDHSFGSVWNLELPALPVGQLNMPLPLSPSAVTYTVARDSSQPNLCTIIRTTCGAPGVPVHPLIPQMPTMPTVPELGTPQQQMENVSVS